VKVLEEENTALRESAKLLDEFRGKAEERKQIMK
jgi:hypothetical protein